MRMGGASFELKCHFHSHCHCFLGLILSSFSHCHCYIIAFVVFNVRASAVALTVHLMIIAKVVSCCFLLYILLVSTLKVRAVALLLIRMDGASLTSEPFVLSPSPTSTFVHNCFTTSDLSQMTQSRDVRKIYDFYRKKPDFLSSRVDPRAARNHVGRCDSCPPSTPFPPFEIT